MNYSADELGKIEKYEEKRGIKYAKAGGKLYKFLAVAGIISWLYMFVMQLFYVLGKWIEIDEGLDKATPGFITLVTVMSVSVIAIILFAFKNRILKSAALFAGCVTTVLSTAYFVTISKVDDSISSAGSTISQYDPGFLGLKKLFYWRHGIAAILVLAIFIALIVIIIRERVIIKKEFDAISQNEYEPQFESKTQDKE